MTLGQSHGRGRAVVSCSEKKWSRAGLHLSYTQKKNRLLCGTTAKEQNWISKVTNTKLNDKCQLYLRLLRAWS